MNNINLKVLVQNLLEWSVSSYYEMENPKPVICCWCMSPLPDTVQEVYDLKRTINNGIVPNCGKKECLELNPAGPGGFIVGRNLLVILKQSRF